MAAEPDKQLLVLGCSQSKRSADGFLPAIDRYDGSPYRVLRSYLREQEWPRQLSVAVLSAKYGLVGGFTGIEDYDQRMTADRATELAGKCTATLNEWAQQHRRIHLSLGQDYLPALDTVVNGPLKRRTKVFEGPIGMKLSQIKHFLEKLASPPRRFCCRPESRSGRMSYFLPDWDDLLDENFDFEIDSFSGDSPLERGDKHCCILMKPKRMCDGILVSLAQHMTSKGPLRRLNGTEPQSLGPQNLRRLFGLRQNQSLFGDCGAFSYANEDEPTISVQQAVALYDLHGFDYGASVDHIPVQKIVRDGIQTDLSPAKRRARIAKTKQNAEDFICLTRERRSGFAPVGIIQGLSPQAYGKTASEYYEMGYRHLAIGGLVPLPDPMVEKIVTAVMSTVSQLRERPWVHLFGVYRPKLQMRFRELGVNSFDSATYFRKAWLRSDQNYLATNGTWYAAIRVPMTSDGRTRKRLESSGVSPASLEAEEQHVMTLLRQYGARKRVGISEVLEAVIAYDERLTRSGEFRSLRQSYEKTLRKRPWEQCDCPFCKEAGIHILIFRGANRNKRRGAHNTLMLYGTLRGDR